MKKNVKLFFVLLAAFMLTACVDPSESTTATDTSELKPCECCGELIPAEDGVATPLCTFVCPDCVAAGAGGTTPPRTDLPS